MAAVHASMLLIGLSFVEGAQYNIAFIVYRGEVMIEKCITLIVVPQPGAVPFRMTKGGKDNSALLHCLPSDRDQKDGRIARTIEI
ncbi:hypothetical protein MTO96_029898, partial [Rhipicephalus appendiculatus]